VRPQRRATVSRKGATIDPMRFPVVLFDLDGTLVDSAAIILASFHHATEKVMRRRFPDEMILAQVGGGNLEKQMARLGPPDQVDELVQVYRSHNNAQYASVSSFDGVVGALERLKREGRRLGVVSAKPRATIELAFGGAGLAAYFDAVVGSDETEKHKPDPEPLLLCLHRLGARVEEAAYVGDSPFDMSAARAAGLHAVGVTWGRIHGRDALGEADIVVETPEELPDAL
jgi:pyrophosphatase PpaX